MAGFPLTAQFPTCASWKDLAHFCKRNLNPRNMTVQKTQYGGWRKEYKDVIYLSEIVTLFVQAGLENDKAKETAEALINLGFVKKETDILNEKIGDEFVYRPDWIVSIQV